MSDLKLRQIEIELTRLKNRIDEISPINPQSKSANLVIKKNGVDTVQSINPSADFQSNTIALGGTKANKTITLRAGNDFGTDTFKEQTWRKQGGIGWISNPRQEYTLYTDHLEVRGTFRAREFILDEIKLNNGDEIWSNSAKVSETDGTTWFDVEDPNENGAAPFAANDVIEARVVNMFGASFTGGEIDDDAFLVKRLIFKVSSVSGLRVHLDSTAVTGAPTNKGSIEVGDVFVRQYNETDATRRGSVGIYATSENAPFIEVRDGASTWATHRSDNNIYFRTGKLDGINLSGTFPDLDGTQTNHYGTVMKGNVYVEGEIVISNPEDINGSAINNNLDWMKTFRQASQPTAENVGDIWIETDNDNKAWRWSGSAWEEIKDQGILTSSTGSLVVNATPGGSGLFLGADYLGYYASGAWQTYMDNSGNFYLGGSSGPLTWNAGTSTLTIDGSIFAGSITSSATITGGTLQTASSGQRMVLNGTTNKMDIYDGSGLVGSIYGNSSTIYCDSTFYADVFQATYGSSRGIDFPRSGNPDISIYRDLNELFISGNTQISGYLNASSNLFVNSNAVLTTASTNVAEWDESSFSDNEIPIYDTADDRFEGSGKTISELAEWDESTFSNQEVAYYNTTGNELEGCGFTISQLVNTTSSQSIGSTKNFTGTLQYSGERVTRWRGSGLVSAPSSPNEGDMYESVANLVFVYTSGGWIQLN